MKQYQRTIIKRKNYTYQKVACLYIVVIDELVGWSLNQEVTHPKNMMERMTTLEAASQIIGKQSPGSEGSCWLILTDFPRVLPTITLHSLFFYRWSLRSVVYEQYISEPFLLPQQSSLSLLSSCVSPLPNHLNLIPACYQATCPFLHGPRMSSPQSPLGFVLNKDTRSPYYSLRNLSISSLRMSYFSISPQVCKLKGQV